MLQGTALALLPPLNLPVPYAAWDSSYAALPQCGAARREAFLSIFLLEIVPIEIDPELPPVDCVVPTDTAQWVLWLAYILTPASGCPDGCGLSTVP